jgi:hypothetical protein
MSRTPNQEDIASVKENMNKIDDGKPEKSLHWYRVKIQIKKEGFKAVQAASMVLCQSAAAAMSVAEKSAHDVLNNQGYTFKIVGVIKEKFLFVVTEKE